MDTKIHPSEKYDRVKFRSDQGGAGPSTLTERKYQQDRYYEIQTDLTLEEARYSEMRKKIPGLGRIPKDRIDRQSKESDFHKRNQAHLCFVKQNFHEIECSKFVPDPEKIGVKKIRDLKCHCGEIFTEHVGISNARNFAERELVETFLVPEELRSHINYGNLFNAPPENLASILSQVTWTKEDAFRKTSCSTFGKICFVNYENSKPAKYIRLSHNDSVDRCLELMDKHWKIMEPKRPSLCISVIGGAKSFKLDNKMRETFNTGLIKAGKSTNAWMITTGSNVGVMKAVGNAVSEGQSFLWDNDRITHTLRLIGIGPWGYVKDRKNLESDGNGCFPVHFQTSNIIQHGKPVPLNPNHTHFVFVDDGFRNNYKGASKFRALFEQKVSKPTQAGGLGIPVVLVILEGGTDAINDAMVSLNHNIPVVVCSGTGRAADILAYAYSHTRSSKGVLKSKHEIKLRDKINEAYGGRWKENEIDKNIEIHFTNVMKCMEHRNLINIFPMNKHEDLDIAILTALLNSKAAEDSFEIRKNQLQLALTWNRADIAQEEIFREDVLWPPRSLDDILMEAIIEEKVEFVALILQQNVGMKEFLSKERLQQLYQKSLLRADADHLKKLMSSKTRRSTFSYDNLKRLMESLMYKYDHDIEERKTNDNITGRKYSLDMKPEKPQLLFKHPYKQLMVWSILMLRQKMAKFAWQMGSEPITSAVAAARIYGSMAKNVHRNESALKEKVLIFKDEFEHLARSVIDECHAKQKEKAMMLAERKSPSWSEMTSLQIAASGKNMVYLSSVACRNSIDATWRRGILSRWQVLVTVFFPFLLFTSFLNVDAMGEKKVRTFQKILTFYTAPITKFTHYSILYIFFVALFTYFLLVDYQPNEITTIESICIFWIFTFIVDEIYTLLTFPSPTFGGKIRDWYGMLKCIDLFNLLFALLAFVIQVITMHTNENAINVRIIFSINCIIFYIRIMKLYTANSSLGPKLEMIKMMFAELTTFLLVVIVFLAAYGVSRHSLLYGRTEASWKIFTDILFHPYWQLYGELDFDNSMKTADNAGSPNLTPTTTSSISDTRCPCWISSLQMNLTNSSQSEQGCPCWYSSVQNRLTSSSLSDIGCLCWNSSIQINFNNLSIFDINCPRWNSSVRMNLINSSITDIECLCCNALPQNNTAIPQILNVENLNIVLVYILCAGYLIIGTILLFNLLIAIFNHIFTKVEEKSNEIWKFQMYFLTMEFDNKTALIPPLSIIHHLYLFFKLIARKTCCEKSSKGVQFTERHLEYLQLFETEEMANYLRHKKSEHKDSAESKLQKRVEELFNLVEEEFTADQEDALTLLNTKTANLTRENTSERITLKSNRWPKPKAVIEFAKKLEEKEAMEVATETLKDEEKIKRAGTKKDRKYKRKLKEVKIYITDQENEAEPIIEPDIEARIHLPGPTGITPPLRHSRNLSPWAINRKPDNRTLYTHRRVSLQHHSSDSEDNEQVKYPVQYKTLGIPEETSSESSPCGSDTGVPRITRRRLSLRRMESSTEDELRSRAKLFQRFRRNRQLSDSD